MSAMFALEPEEEFDELPCDTLLASQMKRGSAALMLRLHEVHGLPLPPQPKVPDRLPRRKLTGPWPRWYEPPVANRKGTELLRSIAADFDLTVGELTGKGRADILVDARAVVVRVLRDRGLSLPQIARRLGRTDHSTTLNSLEKFDIYCRRNPLVPWSYARHRSQEAAE